MTTHTPLIDEILTAFFAPRVELATGITRRRIQQVERALRECCDSLGEHILETDDLVLLAAERQFDPVNAITRTMHGPDLVFVLSLFVDPHWLFDDRLACRTQLRLSGELADFLVRHGLVNYSQYACPLLDIRNGVRLGLASLRRTR